MQLRTIITVLSFVIANISPASAANDGDIIFVTMTTDIDVTSTEYVDTVTMTGQPTTTQEPSYAPLTTIYSNNTLLGPTATGSYNSTAPTPPAPTKDLSNSATIFSGSIRLAAAAGAIAAVLGML